MVKEEICAFLRQQMVENVGFAACIDTPFKGLTTAISMVFPLSDAVVDQIDTAPTHTYFHHYRTMNAYIDRVSLQLVLYLQAKGYRAAAVPASQSVSGTAGIYSHKAAAVRAGLGYIGKSCLFIANCHGPRVRLGTVFTDAPLEAKNEGQHSLCGDCDLCVRACPAMAISGHAFCDGMKREAFFDAEACSRYMKTAFQHIGRGAVCGICMRVCPKGKNTE